MKLDDRLYDLLKYVALVVMPALATLVLALTNIWSIPHGEAIAATITALDTFLGALLKVSSSKYYVELDEIDDGEDLKLDDSEDED